jgi:hypothetical protein
VITKGIHADKRCVHRISNGVARNPKPAGAISRRKRGCGAESLRQQFGEREHCFGRAKQFCIVTKRADGMEW